MFDFFLLLVHALILEKRHDGHRVYFTRRWHTSLSENLLWELQFVAGVRLNLMRDDPSEALFMLRPLVSCLF